MFEVFGFYKFVKIPYLKKNKKLISEILTKKNIRGTVIISKEGVNGTISGKGLDIKTTIDILKKVLKFKDFNSTNKTKSLFQPFHKPKVKIKSEVVPMNLKLHKMIQKKDSHVEPNKWNKLIKDKETIVIDARKPFEYDVGTFKGSVNPSVDNFRDFPKYLKKLKKNQPIAMFCTGGIRCEKASIYLEKKGYSNVYQLKGGILNYLKKTDKKDSLWEGECFVFDNRVSLKHGLKLGSYSICGACRKPISLKNKNSEKYEEGVSCPNCHDKLTYKQKTRFRMRQKQINLAKKVGKRHIFQKEY